MMTHEETMQAIKAGNIALGVEFGSTTVKAVLTTEDFKTIASGSYEWDNNFQDGLWTYAVADIWLGLQTAYANLQKQIHDNYSVAITSIKTMGFSAMMHGYLAFDKNNQLLVPFRTWRNAITGESASELTKLFNFNIPQRWSVAHLYQAILNQETHVKNIDFLTTLAGYVHWQLTDEKVIGIGDASGMFPIDEKTGTYNQLMLDQFSSLKSVQQYNWQIDNILPTPLKAGGNAGHLTEKGAKLLDPTGHLTAGAIIAPPEGDAGTGMVATNSVKKRTGNISVGTSIFSMIVLEKNLEHVYSNIDIVTTPTGLPVAMVHANNSASDLNAWSKLFAQFAKLIGCDISTSQLYQTLFDAALNDAEPDAGGLSGYGYYSGENITAVPEGRPLLVRQPDSNFTIGNLMRLHLFTAFGAIKIGMRILEDEQVLTDNIVAQGGVFKTPIVAQKLLSAALNTDITVMKTAGEGGPWGMAILSLYAANKRTNETLDDFLSHVVFANEKSETLSPDPTDVAGFEAFMTRYVAGLDIELAAIKALPSQKRKE
ncbi:xylulokinase [Leuconostoc gelidum]|uniref:xylulokinase n=1 Tax=Leuconostoc gelidum TaxID=1244 RepID=UPI001CC3F9D5|nr:FGGY-family carbohydrate kinase [Leuconostoc gelidum]MBZ5986609.1 FGGY-family carbohydrate kinase [Leuconostoc gelidum subsp. gelidum]